MALVINTNIASITAQNHAVSSRKEMESAMERLSSGLRINSASDDAAGLAISTRLESQIRGMTKAVQNANDAISLTQTAEGAQQEVTEMLQRIRELAVQSTNSSNTSVDRSSLDAEVQQLLEEIDQIASTTKFNNQKLLDGSFEANIQIGDQLDQQMSFTIDSLRTSSLGLGSATSTSGGNFVVGARLEVDATSASGVSGTLNGASSVLAGDVLINGQELGSLATAEDIQDVVKVINDTIDNVTASAFNTVVANSVGDGVADSGDVTITVVPVGQDDDSGIASRITFSVGASASMDELVENINDATQGYVTASVNGDGKLVLSNDTGASIEVTDSSTAATGFGSTYSGVMFAGMLKLESTDGSDIRIERSFQSTSDLTDLEVLGFRQVGVDNGFGTSYSVQGDNLTSSQASTAIGVNDLKINGVDVYNADIDTDSLAGKIESINAVSDETGVTASAYFEKYYDLSSALAVDAVATATITINGIDINFGGSAATLAANINAQDDILGLKAEAQGDVIRLYGSVNSITVAYTDHGNSATVPFGAAGTTYAGLRLDSINDTPISIDLGDSSTILDTNTVAGSAALSIDFLGLKEMNVGAADFASNAPTLGAGGGSAISGVSVATVAGANSAIEAIDRALEQVSSSAGNLGAIQNRLNHTINNLQETIVNTSASQSRIQDADYAVESAKLAKQQVLQQAATAMLAQANASTQSVLTLLGG